METSYDSIWADDRSPRGEGTCSRWPNRRGPRRTRSFRDGEQVEDADVEIRDLQRDHASITVTSGPNGMTAIARIAGASENIGAIW